MLMRGVWVARSPEGRITTEAPSREQFIERLKVIVPDVLESRLRHPPHDVSILINWQELRTVEQTELMVALGGRRLAGPVAHSS